MTAVNRCDTIGCPEEATFAGISRLDGSVVQLCRGHAAAREKYRTVSDLRPLPGVEPTWVDGPRLTTKVADPDDVEADFDRWKIRQR